MHGHIYAIVIGKLQNLAVSNELYALCETKEDVQECVNDAYNRGYRGAFSVEKWCIESTLEETGEW